MVLVIDDFTDVVRAGGAQILPPVRYESACATTGEWFRDVLLPIWNENPPVESLLFLINANFKFGKYARRSLRHGIELVHHVRLTSSLPPIIKNAPVVLYTWEDANNLRVQGGGGLIVYSPGCAVLRLPDDIECLRSPSQWATWLASLPRPEEKKLRPFVKAADEADLKRLYSHSYRNRAGVLKFIEEFAGQAVSPDHSFIEDLRKEELADLEQKRLTFLMPQYARGATVDQRTVEEFVNSCAGCRFLYVDDEHARGWSLALHAGLSGLELFREEYERLCACPQARTDDGLLHVISSFGEAQAYLAQKEAEVSSLHRCWIDAENAIQRETRCRAALEATERSHQSASAVWAKEENLAQAATRANEVVKLRAQKEKERQARDAMRTTEATLQECKERLAVAVADRERCEATCLNQVELLTAVFPYTAVLLDVRLTPDCDEAANVDDISGFILLRRLRASFGHVPVILMTASENARIAQRASELGVESFWTKCVSSGEDLRESLRRCLQTESDRGRWAKLTVLESRREIRCHQWDHSGGAFSDVILNQNARRRQDLHALLNEAFMILYSHRWNEGYFSLQHPWSAVVRILGLVQEIRWQQVSDEVWNRLPAKEYEFRQLRNRVTHANICPQAYLRSDHPASHQGSPEGVSLAWAFQYANHRDLHSCRPVREARSPRIGDRSETADRPL